MAAPAAIRNKDTTAVINKDETKVTATTKVVVDRQIDTAELPLLGVTAATPVSNLTKFSQLRYIQPDKLPP